MKIPKLNPVEFFVGFFIELPFYYLVGVFILLVGVLSGLLWALGGAEGGNKLFRRIGVPLLTSLVLFCFGFGYFMILSGIGASLALWLGYGEESWLFKFYMKKTANHAKADFLTRMTTYFIFWLSYGLGLVV